MERLLTWGAAGLLLAAVLVIPVAESGREESRRPRGARAVVAALDDGFKWGEERIAGRRVNERTVIRPEMPKPLCVGPPTQPNMPPNIIRGHYSAVREVTVPARVTLLSRAAPVSSSDPAPLGDLSLVTDGDKEGDDGYFVDLLPGQQWVQIDLGEVRELWVIWTWMYHKQLVLYNDVIIQVASEEDFRDARVVFNNDHDNTSGMGSGGDESWVETSMGHPVRLNGVTGRYVRLYSNGRNIDDTNHWIEVEVYGR